MTDFSPVLEPSTLNPCNDGERGVDVVVSSIDKCAELSSQVDILNQRVEQLENISKNYCLALAEEHKLTVNLKSLLKECYNLFGKQQTEDLSMEELVTICTKIEELENEL